MVRQGLRKYPNHCADMELIGEATDGEEAVHLAGQLSPDVVLMDINMRRMNGIEATSLIMSTHP
jgi:DNA-binding NarL/FixJ family response regulator